jgi:hypothetical protein
MNIRLPKAENGIPAFRKVCVTRGISFHIGDLDSVARRLVDSGIAMPEITVPLNDDTAGGDERINDELTPNNLLLCVLDIKPIKDSVTGLLKSIGRGPMWKSQYAIYSYRIGAVVAACARAVFGRSPFELPAGRIERFTASFTPQHFTTTASGNCSTPSGLFRFRRGLPCVSTRERAEAGRAAASGLVLFTAPIARKCRAGITLFGEVRTRGKRAATLGTYGRITMIIHDMIIPWSVATCN